MYDLQISTAPTLEPITLQEAKRHLTIDHNNDDTLIKNSLIPAVRQAAELRTHRQFQTASWTLTLDCFPKGSEGLRLPLGQFQSLDSITHYDSDLTSTSMTLATEVYEFGSTDYPVITPVTSWDSTARKVVVVFTCGYGDAVSDVPELLRQGMLILLAHYYEQRELVSAGLPVHLVPESADIIFMNHRLGNEFTTPVMGTTSWMGYAY